MERVPVHLVGDSAADRSYDCRIGSGLLGEAGALARALDLGADAFLITNPTVAALYAERVERGLLAAGFRDVRRFEMPDGERFKSVEWWSRALDALVAFDDHQSKRIVLVCLGGGVVGDLGGFVAATFRRGTPFVQIPTTLLAQVDSSVGGKTAVNHPQGKNLIGTFWQPRLVVMDTDTLATLPARERAAGFAEIIKYGVIWDAALFAYLEDHVDALRALEPGPLTHVLKRSVEIKAAVVAKDERETSGLRAILNFGHTVGHAVEAATDYARYLHGEAIAIGMVAAADLSTRITGFAGADVDRITKLLERYGLPVHAEGTTVERVLGHLQHDKKFVAGKNRFVLARAIGEVVVEAGVDDALVREAVAGRLA
ncbi:MAG: 3-dehydroquinate synthase [Myxococcales bacterium]|nr:3-dehydroquinate synthase [Myxococcales bacterium]